MITISVLGGFLQTSEILVNLCKHSSVKILSIGSDKDIMTDTYDILIIDALKTQNPENSIDILIVNKFKPSRLPKNFNIEGNSIILINSDIPDNFLLLKNNKAKLITYGFNSKACVTASSVTNGNFQTIQCCIQRSLPTLSGIQLEEQEFPINVINKDIYNVLGAITVALLSNIGIPTLQPLII